MLQSCSIDSRGSAVGVPRSYTGREGRASNFISSSARAGLLFCLLISFVCFNFLMLDTIYSEQALWPKSVENHPTRHSKRDVHCKQFMSLLLFWKKNEIRYNIEIISSLEFSRFNLLRFLFQVFQPTLLFLPLPIHTLYLRGWDKPLFPKALHLNWISDVCSFSYHSRSYF